MSFSTDTRGGGSTRRRPPATRAAPAGGLTPRMITEVLALAALVFVFQNTEKATVNILTFDITAPGWMWMLLLFLAGIVVGSVSPWFRRRQRERADDDTEIGPIDYLVIEFPDHSCAARSFPSWWLVERRVIRFFDLVIVRKHDDGTVVGAEIGEPLRRVDEHVRAVRWYCTACSPTMTSPPSAPRRAGATAAAILWENSGPPLTAAVAAAGGELVAGGRADLAVARSATAAGRENH